MDFLLTEQQLKFLVESEKGSKLTSDMKQLHSFTANLIVKAKKIFGLNLKFLITWGTAIGALVAPLNNYLRENYLEFTDDQIILLLVGIAATFFYQNKKETKKVLELIKGNKLQGAFKESFSKIEKLKKLFLKLIENLNLTLGSTVEMIHYAFLIPIIEDIMSLSRGTSDVTITSENIAERLLASGVVVVSGLILTELISKLIKYFRKN
jgi:hypothetical protein